MNSVEQIGYKLTDQFEYRGKKYGVGTLYTVNGKDYYQFLGITKSGKYHFISMTPHTDGVLIHPDKIDKYDLTITLLDPNTKPLEVGKFYVDTTIGWVWYIVIMLVSLIFKEWYLAWIGVTIFFYFWRKNKLEGKK